MRYFYFSHVLTVIGLALAYLWAGWEGVGITALLMVMEITLSFDNAVVNATVMKTMNEKWRRRFLTWGILSAVVGMRLVFPLLIVGFATGLSMIEVAQLAFKDPQAYSNHVHSAHVDIASFGGMFLLMVFLQFVLDDKKHLHWLVVIEKRLASLGKLESVEIVLALALLLGLQSIVAEEERLHVLTAGTVGVVLFEMVHSITALCGKHDAGAAHKTAASGLMGFLYLQLLDASFSLDGVIGAFAISIDVVIIMIGLGIGAMFVRSLTVFMVHKGTLDKYIFLEHGAHYGIGALAVIMLISLLTPVSEVVTGLTGLGFIALSFWSSLRHNRKQLQNRGN